MKKQSGFSVVEALLVVVLRNNWRSWIFCLAQPKTSRKKLCGG
jgi:hypothetical protein